jgi:hypothetical protein
MNNPQQRPVGMVTCTIFSREVETLRHQFWPDMAIRTLSSRLHAKSNMMGLQIEQVVQDELANGGQGLLVYGDCCSTLNHLEGRPWVSRTQSPSCYELILGKETYLKMEQEGAFFLLSGSVHRWKLTFAEKMDLPEEKARDLVKTRYKKLVYLDTGIDPVPHGELSLCADYYGLPYEVYSTSLDHLRGRIEDALSRLNPTKDVV